MDEYMAAHTYDNDNDGNDNKRQILHVTDEINSNRNECVRVASACEKREREGF